VYFDDLKTRRTTWDAKVKISVSKKGRGLSPTPILKAPIHVQAKAYPCRLWYRKRILRLTEVTRIPPPGRTKNTIKVIELSINPGTPSDSRDSKEKKMKLYLLCLAMDVLTILAYPIIFVRNVLGRLPKEDLIPVKV
jgi:hypothetical protein